MIDALYVASTGMQAQTTQLESISNNLANLGTVGFKKSKVSFDDLIYRGALTPSHANQYQQSIADKIGAGSSVASVNKTFTQGALKPSDSPLDLGIQGQGFFEVDLGNGEMAYTRHGVLKVSEDGYLQTANDYLLSNRIQIPADATNVVIGTDGVVHVQVEEGEELLDVGRIEMANFINAGGLEPVGENLYLPTEASGGAYYGEPGEDGMGAIVQGSLEGSNVDLVTELLDMMVAQRAFEVNSQVIRAADDIMQIINNLRR